jgi:UDP-N-acetylglucosamine:LPS N-acetylglucosamine transferase
LKSKIVLIYVNSGGGHRAAANALREVIRQQQRPWDVEMVSLQELLDSIDFIRKSTGIPFEDIYNIMLRRGWTIGTRQLIPVMHLLIRMRHGASVRVLERHCARLRPDLCVSLVPHYNRAIKQAVDRALPGTPFVTVLTDIADYPPHFWIEHHTQDQAQIEDQAQFVICGSEHAEAQARQLGLARHQVLRASGMILNPNFYEPLNLDRRAERIKLGLRPDRPTGLLLFGGEGSPAMLKIAAALNRPDSPVQLIALCGKNEAVANQLRALELRIPIHVQGFTREIPYYMELSDFFIGKPGPGSISEALAKRLPVIVQRNVWTMVHERYNADWVEQQGVGLVVRNFSSEIFRAVETLLAPENFSRFRERAAGMRNSAVYEIPDFLEEILSASRRRNQPAALESA